MLAWRHSGFTAHNRVRVGAGDVEGRKALASYTLRAPFSLEKTTYDARRGTIIYRRKLHATLKRNFEVLPGLQWLQLLCKHVPDRHEHMVRYYGRYSSRTHGKERERPENEPMRRRTRSWSLRADMAVTSWQIGFFAVTPAQADLG